MFWLIAFLNIVLWGFASLVLFIATDSLTFGVFYFIVGYPLSILFLKLSDKHSISRLEKFKYATMPIWRKKLIWSNSYATASVAIIILIIYCFTLFYGKIF